MSADTPGSRPGVLAEPTVAGGGRALRHPDREEVFHTCTAGALAQSRLTVRHHAWLAAGPQGSFLGPGRSRAFTFAATLLEVVHPRINRGEWAAGKRRARRRGGLPAPRRRARGGGARCSCLPSHRSIPTSSTAAGDGPMSSGSASKHCTGTAPSAACHDIRQYCVMVAPWVQNRCSSRGWAGSRPGKRSGPPLEPDGRLKGQRARIGVRNFPSARSECPAVYSNRACEPAFRLTGSGLSRQPTYSDVQFPPPPSNASVPVFIAAAQPRDQFRQHPRRLGRQGSMNGKPARPQRLRQLLQGSRRPTGRGVAGAGCRAGPAAREAGAVHPVAEFVAHGLTARVRS